MTGYKVFLRRGDHWCGPYFQAPWGRTLRAGQVLRAAVEGLGTCGPGVNFWTNKRGVRGLLSAGNYPPHLLRVYTVETLEDAEIRAVGAYHPYPPLRKARASAVRLVKNVTKEFV